jgi:hypothetical protein
MKTLSLAGLAIASWLASSSALADGAPAKVAVASDGTAWGVNRAGDVFRRDGGAWIRVPGKLAQIAVGSAAHVWGVNAADEIFRFTGNGFARVDGTLMNIAVGANGEVWGVHRQGQIFRREGAAWRLQPARGRFARVTVDRANEVVAVNAASAVFRWTGNGWSWLPGEDTRTSSAAAKPPRETMRAMTVAPIAATPASPPVARAASPRSR